MNGKILLSSQPGKGTVFTLMFADVSAAGTIAVPESEISACDENIIFEPAAILIADDVELNRRLIKEYLGNMNMSFIEAVNGQEAVFLTEQHHPNVILTDIRMPVTDGYEAARQIKNNQNLKNIPVIAVTASAFSEDRQRILQSGFDGYIAKPVQRADLIRELCRFIPYKKRQNETPNAESGMRNEKEDEADSVFGIQHSELTALINMLENEITPLWKEVCEVRILDNIEQFADKIRLTGEEYRLQMLIGYGTNLMTHSCSCDIEKIEAMLDNYPKLIEKIKAEGR